MSTILQFRSASSGSRRRALGARRLHERAATRCAFGDTARAHSCTSARRPRAAQLAVQLRRREGGLRPADTRRAAGSSSSGCSRAATCGRCRSPGAGSHANVVLCRSAIVSSSSASSHRTRELLRGRGLRRELFGTRRGADGSATAAIFDYALPPVRAALSFALAARAMPYCSTFRGDAAAPELAHGAARQRAIHSELLQTRGELRVGSHPLARPRRWRRT